ncbi:hypothetical protein G7Y89_g2295 [Cudoniella acicularis]|uniref:Uncharacterized protein n=1 Tax=Cudoniella acicularis TaxID=354080 RepID=A0A8H4RVH1_9HELO|nr:hypothetical protein G7Y89_g2295 [Cudoniella acicularis]
MSENPSPFESKTVAPPASTSSSFTSAPKSTSEQKPLKGPAMGPSFHMTIEHQRSISGVSSKVQGSSSSSKTPSSLSQALNSSSRVSSKGPPMGPSFHITSEYKREKKGSKATNAVSSSDFALSTMAPPASSGPFSSSSRVKTKTSDSKPQRLSTLREESTYSVPNQAPSSPSTTYSQVQTDSKPERLGTTREDVFYHQLFIHHQCLRASRNAARPQEKKSPTHQKA